LTIVAVNDADPGATGWPSSVLLSASVAVVRTCTVAVAVLSAGKGSGSAPLTCALLARSPGPACAVTVAVTRTRAIASGASVPSAHVMAPLHVPWSSAWTESTRSPAGTVSVSATLLAAAPTRLLRTVSR
jgi:hypothetical protein